MSIRDDLCQTLDGGTPEHPPLSVCKWFVVVETLREL